MQPLTPLSPSTPPTADLRSTVDETDLEPPQSHALGHEARAPPWGAGLTTLGLWITVLLLASRRRPESSTLYHVVQENLDTQYGAVEDGALAIALPKFVKKELEGVFLLRAFTSR
jgi:hypothetical protein